MSFATFGNDLYTGARSINMIGRRKLWYTISLVAIALCLVGLGIRGLNPGLEFTGGTEITLRQVADPAPATGRAAIEAAVPGTDAARVSALGDSGVRVQSGRLSDAQTDEATAALRAAYGVSASDVTVSSVGPTWGADVTRQAIIALVVFLLLAGLVLAVYFRTWRMSAAALVALLHDVVITVGVYAIVGLEITPATVIGFLTILGYSIYDTVVVFDKIRENTAGILKGSRLTYPEAVNLAVNQTLVRSINTSVVALLPVASILFIGALALGAGTLTDIALALFVGLIAGTYSSIFIAPAFYSQLMERLPDVVSHTGRVRAARGAGGALVPGGGNAVAGSQLRAAPGPAAGGTRRGSTTTLERDEAGDRAGAPTSGAPGSTSAGSNPDGPGTDAVSRAATDAPTSQPGRGPADERPRRGPRNQPARRRSGRSGRSG